MKWPKIPFIHLHHTVAGSPAVIFFQSASGYSVYNKTKQNADGRKMSKQKPLIGLSPALFSNAGQHISI